MISFGQPLHHISLSSSLLFSVADGAHFCVSYTCFDVGRGFLVRAAGPVYKLAFGPRSFIVVSDPVMAKHVLRSGVTDYDKGVLASVSDRDCSAYSSYMTN